MDTKEKVLNFLYRWVSEGKLPYIRKGMVEDVEQFVLREVSEAEMLRMSEKMRKESEAAAEKLNNEKNS